MAKYLNEEQEICNLPAFSAMTMTGRKGSYAVELENHIAACQFYLMARDASGQTGVYIGSRSRDLPPPSVPRPF